MPQINAESHSAGSQYIGSKQIVSPTLTFVASMNVLPVCCLASKILASKTHLRFGVTLARHARVITCSLSPSFENLRAWELLSSPTTHDRCHALPECQA